MTGFLKWTQPTSRLVTWSMIVLACAGASAIGLLVGVMSVVYGLGVLLALAAMPVLLVTARYPRVAAYLLCVLPFVDALAVAGTGGAASVSKGLGLLSMLGLLLAMTLRRASIPMAGYMWPLWALSGLVVLQVISLGWTSDPDRGGAAAITGVSVLASAFVMASVVDSERILLRVLQIQIVVIAAVSAVALVQRALMGPVERTDVAAIYLNPGVRASGLTGDPNEFAMLATQGMALAFVFASSPWCKSHRWYYVALGGVCAAANLATLSRSGVLSLMMVMIMWMILNPRVIPLAGIALGSGMLLFAQTASFQILVARSSTGRTDARTLIWTVALRMWKSRKMLGFGLGSLPEQVFQKQSIAFIDAPRLVTPQPAHNFFVSVLFENGILGIVPWIGALLGVLFRLTFYGFKASKLLSGTLSRAYLVAFCALMVSAFFVPLEQNKQLWLIVGITASLPRLVEKEQQRSAEELIQS